MFDILIKNARVIDGTGAKWFRADVGIKDGRIEAVGVLPENAAETVDAEDKYLCPGFIDIHSHTDQSILEYPLNHSRIFQGVTTEVTGNCGMSMAPAVDERIDLLESYNGSPDPITWRGFGSFLEKVASLHPSVNFAGLVGHGTLRLAAMGYSSEKASRDELDRMKALAAESMREGAFGMSSGLIYPPGSYADNDELAEVASALAPYGGFYATHMRHEGLEVAESVAESIETAKRAGVPLEISHHKVTDRRSWLVNCKTTIALVERARREGVDVTCDQYPYRATATTLSVNIGDWAFEGGTEALLSRLENKTTRARIHDELQRKHGEDWDTLAVSYLYTPENLWMCGRTIPEIAEKLGCDGADALIDIVLNEKNLVGELHYAMCEEDIEYIMQRPFVMTGSDGGSFSLDPVGKLHPRNFGTFVRTIAHYSRDRHLFPLEEAVRKQTSLPAARAGLWDRGIIRPGMAADLVLFDLDTLKDDPTYAEPHCACSGILKVYVNGVLTANDRTHTGARAGRVLRKNMGAL